MKHVLIILALTFVEASVLFGQINLEDGLVGYYKMDEGQDTVTVNSAVGDNIAPDGILRRDPQWVEGKFGSGLRFTSGDLVPYVYLGTYNPNSEFEEISVSVWLNWDGLNGGWHGICGKRDDWSDDTILWDLCLSSSTGGVQFESVVNDDKVVIITPEPPPVGEWVHFAASYDGAEVAMYFNGELAIEGEMLIGVGYETEFHFGCADLDGRAGFNGVLDELRFYNRTLSEEEIIALRDYDPTLDVKEKESDLGVVKDFVLSQNYPNPFNPRTSIQYSLSKAGNVMLNVYNTLGEQVTTLINSFQSTGTHSITFDAKDLPGGIYFYELRVGDQLVATKKMLLIK